jgi:protoporphyrinogen oxidase
MELSRRLAAAGHKVTLMERAPTLGGLATAWSLGDIVWDRHYHVTLPSDTELLALVDRLGLGDDVRWRPTRTGLYAGGTLHSVSSASEYLRLDALGVIDKIRIGLPVLAASRRRTWQPLERITAKDWLTRWSGRRAYAGFWGPLLRSKVGDMEDQVSAAFMWAIMKRLYSARTSGAKREMFGYVRGGYATILDRYADFIEEAGVEVQTGVAVERVEHDHGRVVVTATGGGGDFDEVVVTAAAPIASRLVPQLAPDETERCLGVSYLGIVCPSLLLRRPLGGFYTTNITDPGFPFTGVIEMSALVDADELGGRTLVYLPRYLASNDAMLDEDDETTLHTFVSGLRRMFPDLEDDDILASRVSRVRYVLPLSTLGYSDRVPPMTTSVPGVHLVNSSHILNGTLNVNETLHLAKRAVESIAGSDVAATR